VSYRAAVIGLSWIGADPPGPASDQALGTAVPESHVAAMADIPAIELVAGCDIAEGSRARFLETWRERWPGIRAYADYRELLERERPELVSVVTPDHLHPPVVLAALETGARMVLCEKPLAITLDEADTMIEAATRAGVTIVVEYTRRWMPEYVEARRLVRSGAIGPLSQILIHSGGPRAMLWRNHTHVLDLLGYFADSEPEWAWADFEAGFEGYGTAYKGDGGNDPATEPSGNYCVSYRNGVRAIVSGRKSTLGQLVVHLFGPDGQLTIDLQGLRLITSYSEDPRTKPAVARIQPISPAWTVSGVRAALLDVIACEETGRQPASTAATARQAMAITDALLASQARGRVPVPVPGPGERVDADAVTAGQPAIVGP
jgi:predicted dehydrogenase